MAKEINFIRPQEVYTEDGSLTRYTSYNGKDVTNGLKVLPGIPTSQGVRESVTTLKKEWIYRVIDITLDEDYTWEDFTSEVGEIGIGIYSHQNVQTAYLTNERSSIIVTRQNLGGQKVFPTTREGLRDALLYCFSGIPFYKQSADTTISTSIHFDIVRWQNAPLVNFVNGQPIPIAYNSLPSVAVID